MPEVHNKNCKEKVSPDKNDDEVGEDACECVNQPSEIQKGIV